VRSDHSWELLTYGKKGNILDCFKAFVSDKRFSLWKVLPILVSWGLWLARNAGLFENKSYPTLQVSQQALAFLTILQY
jgi:hypothetical protein